MTCKNITISRDLISLFRSAAKLASIFEGSLRHFNKPTSFSFCGILVEHSSVDMLMTSLVCVIPKIIKLKSNKIKNRWIRMPRWFLIVIYKLVISRDTLLEVWSNVTEYGAYLELSGNLLYMTESNSPSIRVSWRAGSKASIWREGRVP